MTNDTPPKTSSSFWNWTDIKGRSKELVQFLPQYLKNPVEGIKRVPSWDWPTCILLEILLSMTTGVLNGVVARSFIQTLFGLILAPIMGLIVSFILSGILYYACLFILKTEVEYRKVFVIVILAKIPALILEILHPIVPFITLFSIMVSALLLIVGLSENFMLEKKKISQIVGTIAGLAMLLWLFYTVENFTTNRIKVQEYTPDSLDQIHKELNDTKGN